MKLEGGHNHYASLDGLRAICIILTLINHTPGNPGINGSVGVDVFFSLSGYLITMLLIREQATKAYVCISCFYIRRAFRIIPLYALTIVLYLIATYIAYRFTADRQGLKDWFSAFPWLATFTSEWRPASAGHLFGHAWTLGIEEKYYIIWPLLFSIFVVKFRGSGKVLLPLAALVFFLDQENVRGYVGLLFGSLLAVSVENEGFFKPVIKSTPAHVWVVLLISGYFVASVQGLKFNVLISLPAAFLISSMINQDRNVYKAGLSHPALVRLGSLTYGIYLIHPLVGHVTERLMMHFNIFFFSALFATMYIGSIIVAAVLQKLFETPLIEIGRKLADGRRLKIDLQRET